jgi:hypothetical protein
VAGVGLLLGALSLTRSEYAAGLAIVTAVWLVRGIPARRAVALAAVCAAGALVFVGPWTVRNAVRFGEFIPTSTNGGETFYLATVSVRYTAPPIIFRLGETSLTHPAAQDRMWWHKGFDNVRRHPVRWLGYDLERLRRQYTQDTWMLSLGQLSNPTARRVATAYWLAIVGLAVAGFGAMVVLRRRLAPAWWTIAAAILTVTVLKTAFLISWKDRLPLTYLLIAVAGLGAQSLVDGARSSAIRHFLHRRPTGSLL